MSEKFQRRIIWELGYSEKPDDDEDDGEMPWDREQKITLTADEHVQAISQQQMCKVDFGRRNLHVMRTNFKIGMASWTAMRTTPGVEFCRVASPYVAVVGVGKFFWCEDTVKREIERRLNVAKKYTPN